jgi:hypothetical protein
MAPFKTTLILRSANSYREGGDWNVDDFDVFDGDRVVGRIYRVNSADRVWFWGVSFLLTNRKGYGHSDSLDEAKVAFRAEYEKWRAEPRKAKSQ